MCSGIQLFEIEDDDHKVFMHACLYELIDSWMNACMCMSMQAHVEVHAYVSHVCVCTLCLYVSV